MTAANTTRFLGFRAPLGAYVAGFGMFAMVSVGYAERLGVVGPFILANWPLVMAAAIPLCLVAALVGTGRVGVATVVGLLVTAWQLTFDQSVIGRVDLVVHWQNLQYRQGVALDVAFMAFVSPLRVPLVGLLVDGA